jgi:hypothetical protein
MGLLNLLGGAIKDAAVGVSATIVGIVAHPVTLVTKGLEAARQEAINSSLASNITGIVVNTGLAAAAVSGIGALVEGGSAGVAVAASKLIPATTKGKVIAAITAPVVIGAVVSNPAAAAKAIQNTPQDLANFGANAATLAANPSLANAKQLITDNPVISGVVGVAAAATIGGGIGLAANTAATFLNSRATKENTAASVGDSSTPNASSNVLPSDNSSQTTIPTNQGVPATAQTQTIQTGAVRRRKRKSTRSVPSEINQNVKINVINSSRSVGQLANKRYINREVLLN